MLIIQRGILLLSEEVTNHFHECHHEVHVCGFAVWILCHNIWPVYQPLIDLLFVFQPLPFEPVVLYLGACVAGVVVCCVY